MTKEEKKPASTRINWYPGHMQKAKIQIQESLKMVDIVVEIRDARIPFSSENPLLRDIIAQKPRLIVLNKKDMADAKRTDEWLEHLRNANDQAVAIDAVNDNLKQIIPPIIKDILKAKIAKAQARGIRKKMLRAMVVGIPNVGKSTFINGVVKKKVAKSENRPGVTKSLQWIKIHEDIELLDTPGVLWPRFADELVAVNLALIGSLNDQVVDKKMLIKQALFHLYNFYPDKLTMRYGISFDRFDFETMIEAIAANKNFLLKDSKKDINKAIDFILTDIRNNRIENVTWEFWHEPYQQ